MFKSIGNYFNERRNGYAKTAGVVGGLYMVGRYTVNRLEDVRNTMMQERSARENVRKRFQQNLQDISFTTMAHLPILAENVLTDMDVEALTAELQSLLKASREKRVSASEHLELPTHPHNPPSEASLASSVEFVHEGDAVSDNGSVSVLSYSALEEAPSPLTDSQSSWVGEFSQSSIQPPYPTPQHPPLQATPSTEGTESGVSSSAVSSNDDSSAADMTSSQASLNTKSKADLWREVKMLAVTRTLTVMYSITLLTLFTHVQLSLLGRYKYVHSIVQLERDEEAREQLETSIASLFFSLPRDRALADIETLDLDDEWEKDDLWREGIDAETERKYLTLSWWILNVGWKDVGERVRRGVEEVFEDVSLKSKVGVLDLHRLISDVRRRVEHEVTFEGTERRINFMSTLLPPTTSAVAHLLTRGGFPPSYGDAHDPAFTSLLEETRDVLASANFQLVLERCLDRATSVLFDGLRENVFVPDDGEDGEQVRLRLAGMLPSLARWSSLALRGLPNVLVDSLGDLHEVAGLAAIIYSDYEDRFR
ncbi:Peroxin-3 [Amylostereum chailletii]|nr:Peroxin-3 [Amylostereum chailletii]